MANSMIDHVDIRVSDVDASLAFYAAALAPLGYEADSEKPDPAGGREIGFRIGTRMPFAIHSPASAPGQDTVTSGAHIAFTASSREAVHAFHEAALSHGGRNIGDPGPARRVQPRVLRCLRARSRRQQRRGRDPRRCRLSVPVTRIDHLVLTVADLERTVAWYSEVAGMRHRVFGEGRHGLFFGAQKINLHLAGHEIAPHAVSPTPGSADLCFIVDEQPAALQARLEEASVPIELGPVQRDGAAGTITSFYLRDPDGNLVELSSYA